MWRHPCVRNGFLFYSCVPNLAPSVSRSSQEGNNSELSEWPSKEWHVSSVHAEWLTAGRQSVRTLQQDNSYNFCSRDILGFYLSESDINTCTGKDAFTFTLLIGVTVKEPFKASPPPLMRGLTDAFLSSSLSSLSELLLLPSPLLAGVEVWGCALPTDL